VNPPENPLEDYKRGDSEVSQRYRELPSDEVPSALDEAILARAREEIQKTTRTRRWRQWTAPFALAASAVLALSILFRSGTERETLTTQQAPQAASRSQALAVQMPSASDSGSESESGAEQEPSAELAGNPAPLAKMAAPPARAPSAAASRIGEPPFEKPIREKLEEAPAPVSRQAAQQFSMTQEQRVSAPPSSQLADQSGVAADAIASAPVPSAPGENALKKAAAKLDAPQAAERWLEDIRKLRAEGNIVEADKQWREFRKTFPDYSVSADDAARPRS
jgi:hypothetical protein